MSSYILSSYIVIFCEEAAVHNTTASLKIGMLTLFTANKLSQLISSYQGKELICCESLYSVKNVSIPIFLVGIVSCTFQV